MNFFVVTNSVPTFYYQMPVIENCAFHRFLYYLLHDCLHVRNVRIEERAKNDTWRTLEPQQCC